MKVNGEAIYGTTASPFKRRLPGAGRRKRGRVGMRSPGTAPDDALPARLRLARRTGKLLVPLANVPGPAVLATGKRLETTAGESGITIHVPSEAPDKIASVVVLEILDKPQPLTNRVRANADGSVLLNAADADIDGSAVGIDRRRAEHWLLDGLRNHRLMERRLAGRRVQRRTVLRGQPVVRRQRVPRSCRRQFC